ncbi:hypothetical protein EJC50_28725 [Paenibacillus albus]|uniref:ABM domain-containing protein n=2 Tax=Paenibacillus albus TaxID=2495582 RepID=A0A3Q8X914_9BACL|nr:hypothetical protein EJC50_28725 [Paenibacillus albus]
MPKVALSNDLVREFVGSAHADLSKVQTLLAQEPGLLHASMNWGGDDWETALGAAAHVGRRDIAQFLLSKGARIDLFAAAMLGELELVKSTLTQYPQQLHALGPHGITLYQHALIGGEHAKEVAAYLKSLLYKDEEGSAHMIVVENRIEVRAGMADAVLERFRTPKSVHTFKGFVRMDVLHAAASEETEEIRVCTTWESEADFQAWANSDSFRHAHAKRASEAAAKSDGQPAHGSAHGGGHGHGAHGGAQAPAAGEAPASGPIVGNKVTIYKVVVSHLPEAAAAETV